MAKSGLYTGIDIGTNTIKVVVAEYVQGQVNILANGNAESEGIKNGIIIDIEKTAMSVRKAVDAANAKAGIVIDSLSVSIPANQLSVEPCSGMIQIAGGNKEIMENDIVEVVGNALMRGLVPEREIISLEPKEFSVDGFEGILDPRGMLGVRLEMKGVLYTGPKTIIHNITSSIERAGLSVSNIMVAPLAVTRLILTEQEREFGVITIDLGAGQTTVSVLKDDEVRYVHTRSEGGDYITKDISTILNTSLSQAEAIKQNYAEANIENASQEEFFLVDTVGQTEPAQVSEYYLSGIVEARVTQIFEKIREDLERQHLENLPGGIVLYGGAAAMPGIVSVASKVFEQNARIHIPSELGLRNPAYTQVISTVKYISSRSDVDNLVTSAVRGEVVPDPTPIYDSQVPVASATIPVAPVTNVQPQYSEQQPVEQTNYQTSAPKEKDEDKPGMIDRVRGMFTNIFD